MKAQGPTVAARLHTFIAEYAGRPNCGNTDANIGQCVGLVECWIDALRLPHVWGNALDLLVNAPAESYKHILNTPTNYPSPGDIVVWGGTWGNGYGHTGICVTGHVMEFTAFQQNDPIGSTPHIKLYSYGGVRGWLHPRVPK
jgi:hypothetical protein